MPGGAPGAPGAAPGTGGDGYTLSFDTGEDGGAPPPVYAGAGSTVALPSLPDRDGLRFTGWYADPDLTEPVTEIVMDGERTVYAGFLPAPGPAEHRAYMLGYPDGDFRPDEGISRAETVVMFTRLLGETPEPGTGAGRFTDIRGSAWYADVLAGMGKYNIVEGYPDGGFRPDSDISRAEFISVCLRLAEKREAGERDAAGAGAGDEAGARIGTGSGDEAGARIGTGPGDGAGARTETGDAAAGLLSAVPAGHWARGAVADAARRGWLDACAEGGPVFAPDGRITRAEAVTVINRMLLRRADAGYIGSHSLTGFRDVPPGYWAYGDIMEASHDHAFTVEDGEERWSPLSGGR
jgi:uncharacterized repeat protein (TIGR02543 family)